MGTSGALRLCFNYYANQGAPGARSSDATQRKKEFKAIGGKKKIQSILTFMFVFF